jgi:hypothetical protein
MDKQTMTSGLLALLLRRKNESEAPKTRLLPFLSLYLCPILNRHL